ncbi:VanZ family protein [Saccharopolyspora rosea]|uniref:VanZ family protein n=1 Tax=Saccharopolyspora rosea TaxID=524884 RepID=A0ABW3FR90_9PSEU|nr:VanZ family protein [Saccharopolyspora rosea]
MSTRLIPALIASTAALALAVVLFVPYVARQYRRRGTLGVGNVVLAFAGLLYALGLVAYVLLPMPEVTPDFCATSAASAPQLVPFRFLDDMAREQVGSGLVATLRNPALTQVLLNVALFVPLGMFVRYMFRRGVAATALIGLGVSLAIECTQLTGDWFLYPCAYRLFDVDDLIANGLGGLLGALAAPVLRMVPGQKLPSLDPGQARPVTVPRRLLAAVCDLVLFFLLSSLLGAAYQALLLLVHNGLAADAPPLQSLPGHGLLPLFTDWLPWLLLAVVVPLTGTGASAGQRIVQLTAVAPDGRRPEPVRRLGRSLVGTGGYLLLTLLPFLGLLAAILAVVSLVAFWRTSGHRGLSYAATGLDLVDARGPVPAAHEPVA